MIISLIGPSGCGKSTQAKILSKELGLVHFSVGALFRQEIESQTDLGIQLKHYVDSGSWAPDTLALEVIKTNIAKIGYTNFVIDGFPRVLTQGRLFEELLLKNNSKLDHIFHLNVPFATILSRRLKAELDTKTEFSDPGRTDETEEGIAARQASYDQSILPILNYYTDKQILTQIDATPDIQTISTNIISIIKNSKSI